MGPKAKKHPNVGLLVAAAAVLALGFFLGSQELTCGSQVMSPGDECVRDGIARSYAGEAQAHEQLPLRFGLLALGIAVLAVVVGLRRRPPSASAQAAWEADFAHRKAMAVQKYLAELAPELRAEGRRAIEVEFAKVEARERKKHGFAAKST